MGFSLSWLAAKGKAPEAVRSMLGLRSTGEEGLAGESPAVGGTTAAGWYLIVLDETEHRLIGAAVVEELSQGSEVVTCTVEEHVMFSEAAGWRDGRQEWRVTHRGEDGPMGLDVSGTPPSQFAAIRDDLSARQDAEGGAAAEVDFLFDIPVALAQSLTGFRHDEGGLDGEEIAFDVLEFKEGPATAKKSWFKRLTAR